MLHGVVMLLQDFLRFLKSIISEQPFLVNFWMEKYPDMTKNCRKWHEIGNHSATHPNMGDLAKSEMVKEIKTTHDKIKELTGQEAKLFRPPLAIIAIHL